MYYVFNDSITYTYTYICFVMILFNQHQLFMVSYNIYVNKTTYSMSLYLISIFPFPSSTPSISPPYLNL